MSTHLSIAIHLSSAFAILTFLGSTSPFSKPTTGEPCISAARALRLRGPRVRPWLSVGKTFALLTRHA